jgi:NDP-mannose synthase
VTQGAAQPAKLRAVILAGGRGTRLAPYTSVLPKPLMPIGDRAILELVVDQLAACNITDITLCVGHLSHLIWAVFQQRENGAVEIRQVQEREALGTAGPLRLVEGLEETFIAMNGDVLTTIDYQDLVAHHREQGNALTIATHMRSIKIDYGVLHLDTEHRIQAYEEKPEILSAVSMGIYVIEPSVLDYLPKDRAYDIPDLVQALLADGERLGAYLYDGLWFDIGRKEDYEQAVTAWLRHEESEIEAQEAELAFDAAAVVALLPVDGHRPGAHRDVVHDLADLQLDQELGDAAATVATDQAGRNGRSSLNVPPNEGHE